MTTRRKGRDPWAIILRDIGYQTPASRNCCGNCIGSFHGTIHLYCSKTRRVVEVHKMGICPQYVRQS